MTELKICTDSNVLADAAASHFVERAASAIAARGVFSVALAGGSSPAGMYQCLADVYGDQVDWSRVMIFWGDERCVEPDHADSNYRMARETLLDHVSLRSENIHRMRGELPPGEAAVEYQRILVDKLPSGRFDLILLGLGDDGHTASLFPDTAALTEDEHLAVANYVPKLDAWRLTLTYPAINAARNVTFLVMGEGKAEAARLILRDADKDKPLPAAGVQPYDGDLLWFLDTAAARLLE